MENRWKEIWNRKKVVSDDNKKDEFERFCELKKAKGFDVAVGNEKLYYKAFYSEWLDFYDHVTELIGIDIKSVFEIGCGSGVNLYMFQKRNNCEVGGWIILPL